MTIKSMSMFLTVLIALGTLGQVSSDLYLPSLPYLIDGLETTNSLGQLSVALYMGGYMLAQLIYGPISDGYGRRYPLLVGIIIYIVATFICASATDIYVFIAGRLFQGLGAAAPVTLSRSMLRDVFSSDVLARYMSFMSAFAVSIMASAPLIGGYFQDLFGWRFGFEVLLCYGVAVLLGIWFFIPETNEHKHPDNVLPNVLFKNIKSLCTSNVFMGGALIAGFSYSGFLAWLTAGPLIIQDALGYSPIAFGWMAFGVAISFVFTAYINAKLVGKYSIDQLILVGLCLMLGASVAMMLVYFLGYINIYAIVVPMAVYSMSTAFTFVNCFARAFEPFPKIAGIATAGYSFIQIGGGFLSSSIISCLDDIDQLPLASWLIFASILCLVFKRLFLK